MFYASCMLQELVNQRWDAMPNAERCGYGSCAVAVSERAEKHALNVTHTSARAVAGVRLMCATRHCLFGACDA